MRWTKNIFCFVVIAALASAAVFCCCTEVTAKDFAAPAANHSCCPTKTDSTHDQQCPHQFVRGEKANLVSYDPHYLGKAAPAYSATEQVFVWDLSSQISLASNDGPPSVTAVPLYLQSHKLRL